MIAFALTVAQGCGAQQSETQLRRAWEDGRRALRDHDSGAFCGMLSGRARARVVDVARRSALVTVDDCEDVFTRSFALFSEYDDRAQSAAKLMYVEVDGDKAIALDSKQVVPAAWRRVDGRWFIDDVGF